MPVYSKVYVPCKTLGSVSNHIPVVTRYIDRRKENILVTCVGKSFHTYGTAHFTLLSVSGLHHEDITCIAGDRFLVFTAAGKTIYAWRRGNELKHKYEGHNCEVHLMLVFGPHLVSIDEDSVLKVWDIKSEKLHLELEFSNNNFQITAITHPATYLNKILLGSDQGSLQLWNLQTSKLVYTFKGWGSGVTVLEQTPAVHVIGIGLKNGSILLHNCKYDETVMKFHQDWGMVTALTFRTDDNPVMISGTVNGYIVLWNLDEQKVFSQMQVHHAVVSGLKCLPNEPLMVSSSPDNSLKLWIFDMPDGSARMLRVREGHSLPPSYIRFHGANGHNLLSASGDSSLRIFNTVTDTFNKSLGRASYNRKASKKKGRFFDDPLIMPPIVKFTSETTREKEWDNIAAVHMGIAEVTTWSYDKLKMGELKLVHDRFLPKHGVKAKASSSSICLTHCGNFVVVGYTSGHCDRFNIQSGQHRETYGNPTAHVGAVRGVVTDALSQFVVTGGHDRLVKWWTFKQAVPLASLALDEPVTFFSEQSESSLFAVGLEDFTVVVIDNDTKNVVRKFLGHSGRLTDAAFSTDSRWLVSSAMDRCICTWDIPSGSLVDVLKVASACTSLAYSPTGELLATTHVDDLAVYLWSNRTIYGHVSWKPIALDNPDDWPVTSFHQTQQGDVAVDLDEPEEQYETKAQLDPGLVTLSALATSRWQNLLNIDVIKQRNKPKDPPKTPKAAPFFLPTIPALDIQFDYSNAKESEAERTISLHELETLTPFGRQLLDTAKSNDLLPIFEKMKCMGPSAIAFEINSLSVNPQFSTTLLLQFMKMIQFILNSKCDFELAQAYLGLFLKVHGKAITEDETLVESLENVQECHSQSWEALRNDMFYNVCVVQSLKNL